MSRILETLKKVNPKPTQQGVSGGVPRRVDVSTPRSRVWTILVVGAVLVAAFSWAIYEFMPKPNVTGPQAALSDPMQKLQTENRNALMKLRQGDTAGAKAALQKLVLEFPKEADLFVNLAMVYKKLGELDKAEMALQSALSLSPKHSIALNNLGMIFAEQNRFVEAAEVLRKAADDSSKYPEFIYNLAQVYEKDQQLGLSIEYYKRYISHPTADKNLARRLEKRLPRLNSLYTYQKRKGEG